MSRHPTLSRIAAATALAALQLGAAHAQTATPATPQGASAQGDGLKLDEVVVTGTSSRATKMKSSVSISTPGFNRASPMAMWPL